MRTIASYPMQHPRPMKPHTTGKHHIAPGPMKTGTPSSGGGTEKGHGHMMKRMKRKRFHVPQPDMHGYY